MPGLDRLSGSYYKCFTVLQNSIHFILEREKMPGRLALIAKEGHDLTLMRNYRPISLLNIDYKMFTMILQQL